MKAEERRSREVLTHRVTEHPIDRVDGERPDVDAMHAILEERPGDAQGIFVGAGASSRRHQADRLLLEAARDELQDPERGEIHPLDVVDGQDDGVGGGRRPKASEDGQGDGPLVGPGARARDAQEGHLEGPALGLRQGWERVLEDRLEEVTESGVGKTRLRLDRTARERPVPALSGTVQAFPPHGGLPDPGFTGEEQRSRAGRESVEEAIEDRELGLAPDDVAGHQRPSTVGRRGF